MKDFIKQHLLALCITAFLILADIAFVIILAATKLLSVAILLACFIVSLALTAGVFFLAKNTKKRVLLVLSCVLMAILLFVETAGCYFAIVGSKALKDITTQSEEYSEISVYVRKDDAAQSLSDIAGYKIGILEIQDRESTDFALSEINKALTATLETGEYESIERLMDGLLFSQKVDAIVVNESFLELLEDTEDHKSDKEKIRKIHTVKSLIETPEYKAEPKNENIFTVYISGIDCFGSIRRRSRSDVNILATVNMETGQILLVSTPRDYFVPLSISNGQLDKLTHAGIYGINVSRDTLCMLYDIDIDYYFRVNFDGFKDIIDALGGVTVNSQYAFSTGGYTYSKGENFLNGEQALSFARERYSVAGGDRQRGRNQMAVIKGVIDKATSPAIIANYKQTLDSLKGAFETDMPYERITELIKRQLAKGTKWNVTSYSADGTGAWRRPYSLGFNAYVMLPDMTTIEHGTELMKQVRDGEIPIP